MKMDKFAKVRDFYAAGNTAALLDVLELLPVDAVDADEHALRVVCSRPLTASEAFALGSCGLAYPQRIGDNETEFFISF